jgi:lactoylglutathione lyase
MNPEVHHVSILTEDIDESIRFYRDNLGMRLISRFRQEDGMETAFLGDGLASTEYQLELAGPPFHGWMAEILEKHGPSLDHHALLVEDLKDWVPKLKSEGIDILESPRAFLPARHMVFKDPSGTVVELVEGASRPPQPEATEQRASPMVIDYLINHSSILCNDLDELESFYNRVFGMRTVYDHRDLGYILVVDPVLEADSSREAPTLEIMGPEAEYEREQAFLAEHGPGLDHLCFVVEDVDAAYRDLLARGVKFPYPPEDSEFNRLAFFKDPNGVDVELMLSIPRSRMGL